MVGFIFLHRDLLEWEWYQNPEVSRLYIHLLLKANFTDKKWQGNEVKRGQLITSANHLASELKLSVQQIRTSIKKLDSSGYITRHSTSKFTLITVVNYDIMQSPSAFANKQTNKQTTNQQHSINNQSTTTKESNKEKMINKEKIEQRKENFKKQVFEHSQYSNEILNSFFNYWSELNSNKSKMRFERDDFFNVQSRLEKWQSTEKTKSYNTTTKNTVSNR